MTAKTFVSILTAALIFSNPLAAQDWAWEKVEHDNNNKSLVLSEGLATDNYPYPVFECRKDKKNLAILLRLTATTTLSVAEIIQKDIYPDVLLEAKSVRSRAYFSALVSSDLHGWIMEMSTDPGDPIWRDVAENGHLRAQIGTLNEVLVRPGLGEKIFLPFATECSS